jgi:hypothetical protein
MDDAENLAKSYAARLLALDDVSAAAKEMFHIVESVLHDEVEYEKTKIFILQIVRIMDSIDPKYNHALAVAYYALVSEHYK